MRQIFLLEYFVTWLIRQRPACITGKIQFGSIVLSEIRLTLRWKSILPYVCSIEENIIGSGFLITPGVSLSWFHIAVWMWAFSKVPIGVFSSIPGEIINEINLLIVLGSNLKWIWGIKSLLITIFTIGWIYLENLYNLPNFDFINSTSFFIFEFINSFDQSLQTLHTLSFR